MMGGFSPVRTPPVNPPFSLVLLFHSYAERNFRTASISISAPTNRDRHPAEVRTIGSPGTLKLGVDQKTGQPAKWALKREG